MAEVLVLAVLLGREELRKDDIFVLPINIRHGPNNSHQSPFHHQGRLTYPHLYSLAISTSSFLMSTMRAPRQKSLGILSRQLSSDSYRSVLSCTSRKEPTPGSGHLHTTSQWCSSRRNES